MPLGSQLQWFCKEKSTQSLLMRSKQNGIQLHMWWSQLWLILPLLWLVHSTLEKQWQKCCKVALQGKIIRQEITGLGRRQSAPLSSFLFNFLECVRCPCSLDLPRLSRAVTFCSLWWRFTMVCKCFININSAKSHNSSMRWALLIVLLQRREHGDTETLHNSPKATQLIMAEESCKSNPGNGAPHHSLYF